MPAAPRLGHVAVQADDLEALTALYTDVFGYEVVSRSRNAVAGNMVFLTRQRFDEDHPIQLIERREGEHVALRVDTLGELKEWHAEIRRRAIPVVMTANHGTQVGFILREPASGRLVEVYWPTGRADVEPSLTPIDLELPEEEIMAAVRAIPAVPAV